MTAAAAAAAGAEAEVARINPRFVYQRDSQKNKNTCFHSHLLCSNANEKNEKRKAKIRVSIHELGHGHVTEKGQHPLGAFGVMGCI